MKLLNTRMAGLALVALFGGVMIFQILMALGLHLQGATWGGRFDSDPMALRMASIIAGLILLFAILVVLEKLGIVRLIRKRRIINGILWFLAAYLLLNTVANLFSPGVIERWVMTPLALMGSILCLIVARAPFAEKP